MSTSHRPSLHKVLRSTVLLSAHVSGTPLLPLSVNVLQDWTNAINLLTDSCSKLARQEMSKVLHCTLLKSDH